MNSTLRKFQTAQDDTHQHNATSKNNLCNFMIIQSNASQTFALVLSCQFYAFFLPGVAQIHIQQVLLYQIQCDLGFHGTPLWEAPIQRLRRSITKKKTGKSLQFCISLQWGLIVSSPACSLILRGFRQFSVTGMITFFKFIFAKNILPIESQLTG